MERDIIKVRRVGKTLVVTLTQGVLGEVPLKEGEKVLMEAAPPRRIILSREDKSMSSTRRTELELEVLKDELALQQAELDHLDSIGTSVSDMEMTQFLRNMAEKRLEISRKELELFDLQGS